MGISHKIPNMEQFQDPDANRIFLREQIFQIQSNVLFVWFVLRGSASVALSYKLKVIIIFSQMY